MRNSRATRRSSRHALRAIVIVPSAAFALLFSSCASVPELPWAPVARDASAGFYETARLEYRLDAGKLGQPLDVVRVDGQRVNYEQINSSPMPDRSVGTLVIQQPHPAGREGYARVTFSIDSTQPATDSNAWKRLTGNVASETIGSHEEVHEIWAMDVTVAEAGEYFKLLSSQNFYNASEPDIPAAHLAVTLDGRKVIKGWESLPELNALAQRVRREGQLVAYLRPQALAGEPSTAIASVKAYREMLARTSSPAGTAPRAASGIVAPRPSMASNQLPYAAR